MLNELSCSRPSTNENSSTMDTATLCYNIEAFVPLPCADDHNVSCITKRIKVTGFKKCIENEMTETNAVLNNNCT